MGSQYCTPQDCQNYAVNPNALVNIGPAQQVAACVAASEKADSYMRGRYTLPLIAWGTDVTMHTAWMAVFIMLSSRGFNPEAGADILVKERYDDAVRWFEGIQRQAVHPDVTPQTPTVMDPVAGLPQVTTDPIRGWQSFNPQGTPRIG